jgi:hypothetical protein
MILYYYSTTRADIRDARAADLVRCNWIEGRGQAFADRFGAIALFTSGFNPVFAGIRYTHEKPCPQRTRPFWDVKKPQDVWVPKTKGVNGPDKTAYREMCQEFMREYPKDETKAWESSLLAALGVSEKIIRTDAFGGILHYKDVSGVAYLKSSCAMPGLDEMTASAFVAATTLPVLVAA